MHDVHQPLAASFLAEIFRVIHTSSDCHFLRSLRPPPPSVSEFLEQFARRFCVLPVGQAEHQRHHGHASYAGARQHDVSGGAPLGVADQQRYADVHVDEVGNPARQKRQRHRHHAAGVPQVQPLLAVRGLTTSLH